MLNAPTCNPNDYPPPYYYETSRTHGLAPQNGLQAPVLGQSAAPEVIGTTPKLITKNFASVIERNFSEGSAEHIISNLSNEELSDLAQMYQANAGVSATPLLKTFATRLSNKSLLRVAKYFNQGSLENAVSRYSRPAVRASFRANLAAVTPEYSPALLPPPPIGGGGGGSGGGGGTGGGGSSPGPAPDMSIEDIYLEYRTAPVGNLSPASALAETSKFVAADVGFAAAAGTAVGTAIHWVIEKYDPSLDDAIGGTVANMKDQIQNAATQFSLGHYESAIDQLFGFPVTNSFNPYGDWSVYQAMPVYYGGGGGCGL